MIQVDMQRRKDRAVEVVLQIGEPFIQQPYMMVVNQRNRSYYLTTWRFPRSLNQFITNQVAKGLGPVGVTPPCNEAVEFMQ